MTASPDDSIALVGFDADDTLWRSQDYFDAAQAEFERIVGRYDDLGDVKIQLVTFGDGAKGQSVWMTVDQAKTLINSPKGEGGTNYDGALAAARTAFGTSGKIAGGVNVSYFITDGQPTKGKALDSADESSWETFLGTNKIDSYAIGTGSLTSTHIAAIEPVAYNGITGTEKGAVTLGTNAELGNYLLDTVPVIQKGTLAGLAGADGLQRIESFTASGQLGSSLDSSGKVLTIQLKSGGTMQVNLETGDFTLSQPRTATTNESFSYTLVDKDGDRGTGTVSLTAQVTAQNTAQNTAPEAFASTSGHNLLGLVDLSVNPLLNLSKTQQVAVNDVDNNLVRVEVQVDALISLGALLGDRSSLSITHDAALTAGLKGRAAVVTNPTVAGFYLSPARSALEQAGYDLQRLGKGEVNYGEKLKPMSEEAKAWKTVWSAGQGAGGISDLPRVAELITRLDQEYRTALARAQHLSPRG